MRIPIPPPPPHLRRAVVYLSDIEQQVEAARKAQTATSLSGALAVIRDLAQKAIDNLNTNPQEAEQAEIPGDVPVDWLLIGGPNHCDVFSLLYGQTRLVTGVDTDGRARVVYLAADFVHGSKRYRIGLVHESDASRYDVAALIRDRAIRPLPQAGSAP